MSDLPSLMSWRMAALTPIKMLSLENYKLHNEVIAQFIKSAILRTIYYKEQTFAQLTRKSNPSTLSSTGRSGILRET